MRKMMLGIVAAMLALGTTGCEAFWIWLAMDTMRGEEETIVGTATPDAGGGGAILDVTSAGVGGSGGAGGASGSGGSSSSGDGGAGGDTSSTSTGCVPKTCDDYAYPSCGDLEDGCNGTLSCPALACPDPWQTCGSSGCACTSVWGLFDYEKAKSACESTTGGEPYFCGTDSTKVPAGCKAQSLGLKLNDGTTAELWCCQ